MGLFQENVNLCPVDFVPKRNRRRAIGAPGPGERRSRARVNLNNLWPVLENEENDDCSENCKKARPSASLRIPQRRTGKNVLDYDVDELENLSLAPDTDPNYRKLQEEIRFFTMCSSLKVDIRSLCKETRSNSIENLLKVLKDMNLSEKYRPNENILIRPKSC